jgi:diguanylate cyclase (GGDEF)-like protein/PAS domain S-box-containing protein
MDYKVTKRLLSLLVLVMAIYIIFQLFQNQLREKPINILLDLVIFCLLLFILKLEKSRERLLAQGKLVETHLQESEQRYKSLYDYNTDAIITFDLDGFFVNMNDSSETISGHSKEELKKMTFAPLILQKDLVKTMDHFTKAKQGEPQNYETTLVRKDHQHRHLKVTNIPIRVDQSIVGIYAIVKDITEEKRIQEKINHMAYHDSLTDLPNRILLYENFNKYKIIAQKEKQIVGVINMDLDRFKFINDSLGRTVGDLLLIEVSKRLVGCIQKEETVSRLGGDEFAIIVKQETEQKIVSFAQKVLNSFQHPFKIENHELYVTPSIGIAVFPLDGETLEALLKKADRAMYKSKQLGKNNLQCYSSDLHNESEELIESEGFLRNALERDELLLHYQPKFNLNTKSVLGAEALVRWNHPTLGLVPPMKFIPLAEETGLIVPIGEWVLRTACQQVKEWQLKEQELFDLSVCVNLSVRQLYQSNLTEMILAILKETRLDPKYLVLEITESLTMDIKTVTTILSELKDLGVKISIDDFGTGYSSLSYLVNLPIDYLKVDKSFIKDLTGCNDYRNIVSTIILMAHNLGLEVIAEGVETEEQYQFLLENKCDQVQGFLFSKPVEKDQFVEIVQEMNRRMLSI